MTTRASLRLTLLSVLAVVLCLKGVAAQERAVPAAEGPTRSESNESGQKASDKKPGEPSEGKSEADKAKSSTEAKPQDDGSSDSLKRPDTPPRVPDPREFDVAPDENALVRFNFYGQAWPDVLQWLATISKFSLDWQELPKDYINITTSRSYTVPETRDLFNRLLLDRGYTMVEQGRVLSVVKISKLDPSLLPRVEDESELLDLPPHNFVKFTFTLPDELVADKFAAEIKPLLSPHARVAPLLATNRLLVIDAVINLREVSRLVNAEHAAATGHAVPREFVIRHARASQVADQVMILLGLDPSSRRTPQELQVEQQRLQLFQQMQQKNQDIAKYLRAADSPPVFLAVNDRNNSILANAPPAEMRIIEQAIQQLDVPSASASGELTGTLSMEKYPLVAISPQSVVTALEEIGDLDPRTRLKTDSDAKIVFAHATARDHEKIRAMIDELDGTGRQLEVIWLRRLPAGAVAITLTNLLVGKVEKDDSSGRRSWFYYPSSRDRGNEKPQPGFRVDADLERNRLLLWANESELKEVRKFLEKLGEIPGRSGNPNTIRFLAPRDTEDLSRTLDELRRAWKGPNPLQIAPAEDEQKSTNRKEDVPTTTRPPKDLPAPAPTVAGRDYQWAVSATGVLARASDGDQGATPPTSRPTDDSTKRVTHDNSSDGRQSGDEPISVTATPDGQIMLQSKDTAALDELEDLIASLTPPAPDFKIFHLKYAMASVVTLNLEDYFKEETRSDTDENWLLAYYGFDFKERRKSDGGLGERRKIRFIYDYDTNSILVADASPAQLKVVETLIELYDVPPSEDSISARGFEMFTLKYSRAEDVAATIKEVFRDLLSSKDKDFDSRGEKKEENSQSRNYYRIVGSGTSDNKKPTKVRASFEGALSVGVDKIANAVIVSAQEEWMPTIAQMIEFLDNGAAPQTTVVVHQIPGRINAATLHQTLKDALGEAWVGNRRPEARQQAGAQSSQPDSKNRSATQSEPHGTR